MPAMTQMNGDKPRADGTKTMTIHDFQNGQMVKVAMPEWLEDALYALGPLTIGSIGGWPGMALGTAASVIASLRRALRRELAKDKEKDEKDEDATESKEKQHVTRSADKLEKSAMPLWLSDILSILGATALGGVGGGATGAVLDLLLGSRAPVLALLLGGIGGGTGYATGFASALRREVRRALRGAREKGREKTENSKVDRSTSRKTYEDEDEEAEISLKGLADELKKYD